jgi:hypothetical protein
MEKEVKTKVYADLQIYFDQLLVRLQDAGELHDYKAVFNTLARFGSKKIKPGHQSSPCLPYVEDGSLATSDWIG